MAETFETLKARILDWLAADATRLPDAVRGDCINLIQRRVMRNHDLRFGETADTLALVANDHDYNLPVGWRSPLSLWYINPGTDARIDLVRKTKDEFDALYPDPTAGTDTPINYTVWGGLIYFGPTPNQSLTLNLNYYKVLPDLVDGSPNNTNDFVDEAWDVLFYGAMEEACKYLLEDQRAAIYGGKFLELEADLAGEHQREKSSGRVAQSRIPG